MLSEILENRIETYETQKRTIFFQNIKCPLTTFKVQSN